MAVVYINGKYYDNPADATISIWDHGFLYGDGIFEGIRTYNGKVFRSREHLKRLYDSAKTLNINIPISIDEMEEIMLETIRRSGMKETYIRLIVSRGIGDLGLDPRKCNKATVIVIVDKISLFPEEKYKKGVKVIIAATRKNFTEAVNPNVKSLNYINCIMAKMEANSAGADEAIVMNIHGYVTEGSADNIFVVKDGVVKTPPSYAGILLGITRGVIIESAKKLGLPMIETNMTSHDLYTADEIFLTGTACEMIPVIDVDGRVIGDGTPGPIYKKLREALREVTASEGTPVYKDSSLVTK